MAAMSANPEMTTFSYAQAAKGVHAAPQPAKAASTDSSKTVPQPDEQNTDSSPQTNADAVPAETETTRDAEKTPASADKDSELTPTKPNVSGTSSPSVGTTSTSATGKDDGASTPNGTSESTWDKQSQASATEKPSNGTETEGTKGKSNPTSEKAPPKELKAAPLPTVNIWQQRKEAQDAKAKAIAALKPAGTGASKTASAAPSVSGDNAQEQPKTASKKKGVDGVPEGGKDRKRTDGRKGRDEGASIPPVEDAALWPTPQVAQGEEKRKAQEKSEKGDKSPVIRPHGKEKWMPVPYVPTAVFSTPLPSSGRRGGRAARGGRDGARSGTHGAGSSPDKSSAQGSLSKQAVDRGRGEQNAARANSLPAQSRRSDSADVAKSGDPRKNSQPADRSRGAKGEDAAGRPTYGSETFPRQAKPFSRNHEFGMNKGDNRNLRLADGGSRSGDRRFENGPKSADFAGFQGDHKDRDYHRDSRADRGRGSHRGRGGHAGYGSQNSQFGNAHMPHSPFVHPKSFGFNDRQRSQGVPNGSQQGPRMPLRSPSLPNSAAMYGVYPFSADINPMYGYPPMHPGTMSAVPYQPYMEPFSVMSMLSMQLEYYFSVDNLCKDVFLRRHMDSQGFVPLNLIAEFKRIKSLTEDFDMLRHVSRQLRNVEHQTGADGVDRLRPREKWEQWVVPMEYRDPVGQSEGPPPPGTTEKSEEGSLSQSQVDDAPNGTTEESQKSLPNGTGTGTPLSSEAPEFSPSKPVAAQSENTNVWIPNDGYSGNW